MNFHPISWGPDRTVRILDQTLLPVEERYLDLVTVAGMAEAIRALRVRGAPLIGISAAMGVTLAIRGHEGRGRGSEDLVAALEACDTLHATRPTAVNLFWALDRMRQRARSAAAEGEELHAALVQEATAIWDEDRAMCDRIGEAGLPLIPEDGTVLTHCNAGALATGGIGTALAPIYRAHRAGRRVKVVADETRPLLQGSRLSARVSSQAVSRLRRGDIACVIVGADRIARNGDVANKIGTYALALAARAHNVPFYVAAPRSTFDSETASGAAIPIEERSGTEVRQAGGAVIAAQAAEVWNPAFDVTPAALVTGYITDAGLLVSSELGRLSSEFRVPSSE